jgi:UDP-N-acetylmuramoyl-tripeptide--D-alanyl-D-alanine ligase
VRHWSDQRVAGAAGAELVRGHQRGRAADGPARTVIDSRAVQPGDLFVGIPGEHVDGGAFAAQALEAGAWGVLVAPAWAAALGDAEGGAILASEYPVPALGALARAWRRDLSAHVIAVTGSVGKTSTKDLIAALIAPHRAVAASRENYNTEIGMPLEILAAPLGTEVLVLEAAMRGFGQIAELAAICEPDVGVITNVGPVHLEQMGSLEGVARAKAELLAGVRDGGTAVVPSDEPLLEPYLRPELDVVTFGPGGDVSYEGSSLRGAVVPDALPQRHAILARGERVELELPFDQRHHLLNTLAAVAAARAVGVRPGGRLDVRFSGLRGERVALGVGAMVINDCYNANPLSMRAALDDLAAHEAGGRRIAVLGDMLELGPAEDEHHRDVGAYAATAGVDLLVTVGPRAARMLDAFDGEGYAVADAGEAAALAADLIGAGDVVLVKGSRGVGLEIVAEALGEATQEGDG